jgi:hypothetical protein
MTIAIAEVGPLRAHVLIDFGDGDEEHLEDVDLGFMMTELSGHDDSRK